MHYIYIYLTSYFDLIVGSSSVNNISKHRTDEQYRKNSFAETSKNLATDLKIILLDYQNNYVGSS